MSDVAEKMRELSAELFKRAKKAGDLEFRLDAVAGELAELAVSPVGASRIRAARSPSAAKGSSVVLLDKLALAGVPSLEIVRRADDSSDVRVAGGKWFSLTPMLTDLLSILASESVHQVDDGLVGWHPFAEVVARLSETAGRSVSKHAVAELLLRLRGQLSKAGVNPRLIQVNRRRGVRFALRHVDQANRR